MATSAQPDRNYLFSLFQKVDRDGSGAIDAAELQLALSNGNFTPFNPDTVRLMIGMFDKTNSNVISFENFGHLWKYVTDWQQVFLSFDRDHSNSINKTELKNALTNFGYRFSDPFFDVLMNKFDRSRKGVIYFDDFIQCCIVLHRKCGVCSTPKGALQPLGPSRLAMMLTQAFAAHDTDRDGVITIGYEQFLHMIFSTKL